MTPDGARPTPQKRYYDILCYLITQAAFSFTVNPFIMLTFSACYAAWSRVYFYCIIGTVVSFGFLASPAKPYLKKRLAKRNNVEMHRTKSQENPHGPGMGLPDDPAADLDEMMEEVDELRKQRGQSIREGMKQAFQEKVDGIKQAQKDMAEAEPGLLGNKRD